MRRCHVDVRRIGRVRIAHRYKVTIGISRLDGSGHPILERRVWTSFIEDLEEVDVGAISVDNIIGIGDLGSLLGGRRKGECRG